MKKILLAFASVVVAVFLTACGTNKNSLDGEYHRYFISSNTKEMTVSKIDKIEIEGALGNLKGSENFSVDTEKKILIFENKSLPYVLDGDVLSFNGDTYVKVGTDKYDEIYSEYEKTIAKYK